MSRRAKKRLVVLVVVVGGLAIALGAAVTLRTTGRARAVEQAREAGMEAFERGDYLTATDQLGRYVSRNRDDGEAVLQFVEARRRTPMVNARHLLIAVQYADLAVQVMPGDVRPLEAMMELRGEMGFLTEYLETADRILAIDPEHREAHIARITGLAAQGEAARAMEAAETFARIHPDDWRAHAAIMDLKRTRGDAPAEVLAYMDGVASEHFENMNIAIQQARAAVLARDEAKAMSAIDRAASLRVPDADSLKRLVSVLDALNQRDRASAIIAREIDAIGDEARIVAVDRAWKDGRARAAVDLVREAIESRNLDDVDANLLGWGAFITSASEEAQDEGMAARLEEELRDRTDDEAASWIALIEAAGLMRSDNLAEARERLAFAQGLGRQDLAEFMLGQADLRVGDRRGAIGRWRTVIERDPRWVAARMALAQALIDDGEIREAHSAAIEALRLAPDRVLVAQLFARTAAALADADIQDPESTRVAIGALERIVNDERVEAGPSLALLARLKAADGDLQGAQRIIDRILEERPTMAASDALALAATIERRRLRGGEALLGGSGQIANDPAVLFARAMKAAQDGRVDEGKAILRDAEASAPTGAKESFVRARTQFLDVVGDSTALEAMRSLSAAYPESPAAQRDVLRSRSAWNDPDLIRSAIERLRAVIGEQSPAWRVFEARRLLTFRPAETSKTGGDPTSANAAEVVLMLSNVVRNDPGDAQAAALLSEAHLLLNQRDRAINALSAAVIANPGEPTLYPRLIALLQEKGDTAAAEQRLREFLRIREVPTQLRRARVDLLLAQGLGAEALPELEQLAQSGNPDDLARLAAQYGRLGRGADATRLYEQLEASDEQTVGSIFGVAEYRLALGQTDRALAALDRLPDDVPESRRMTLRAELLERADRADEATSLYEQVAESENTGDAWLTLTRHYVRMSMPEQAMTAVKKAYQAAPNDPAIRSLAKGLALATGQEPPEGLEDIEGDLGGNAEMRVLAAIQNFRQDSANFETYIRDLGVVVSDFPRYFPARRLLVMAHAERGDWDNAVQVARDAARVLPIDPQPAQLLTEVYAARAEAEDRRGLTEARRQYTETALAAAREWRSRALGDPFDADVAIADLQDRLNNPREALRTLEPYTERLDAAGFIVAPLRARLYAKTGQIEQAERVLMPEAQSQEDWAVAHAETARHLTNDPQDVRAWLERSESYVGDSPRGRALLAQSWYDLARRTEQERDHLEATRILESLSPQERAGGAALLAATIYELLGRLDDAERVYREALTIIPEEPITLNNLSYLLSTQGVKLDEAIELAERSVANAERFGLPASQRVNFIDSLGTALQRAGRHEEAATVFRDGMSLMPTNRLLMMGLAESLIEMGEYTEARRWLTQLAQTSPVRAEDDPLNERLREARARYDAR